MFVGLGLYIRIFVYDQSYCIHKVVDSFGTFMVPVNLLNKNKAIRLGPFAIQVHEIQ